MPGNNGLSRSVKFLDSLGLLFYSWDPAELHSRAVFHGRSFARLTGYSPGRLKDGTFWSSIVHQEDRALYDQMIEQLRQGVPTAKHYRVIHKSGKVLWVSDHGFPTLRGGKLVLVEGLVRDISETVQIQEALEEAEAHFRVALRNSPIAVFNQDKDFHYTWIFQPQIVTTPSAVVGRTDLDLLPYEAAIRVMAIKQRILDSGEVVRDEFRVTRNGAASYFDLTGEPLRDASGEIVGITCATMDITERRLSEEKLRESESRFRSIFENAAVGVALVDRVGKVITANDAYCRFLGCSADDAALEQYPEYACQNGSSTVEALSVGTADGFGIERRFVRRDGQEVWGRMNLSAVRDSGGNPLYTVMICEDVTTRKRAEEALQQNQRLQQRINDSTPTLICILDIVEHQNIYINQSASAFLGCSYDHNHYVPEVIHPDDVSLWEDLVSRLQRANDEDLLEATFRLRCHEHEWHTLQTWNRVFSRDPDGQARQILSCAMDITEHQRALQVIQQYQEQLLTLTSQISLAQEHERRQIAVVLHDQIGQLLAMARMKLRAALKPVQEGDLKENLGQVTVLIEESLRETRSLTFELSPPILAELGFESAVAWLAQQMDQRYGLKVQLRKSKGDLLLNAEMAAVLYQAVRELLMNVVKHARVNSAQVSIREQGQNVHVLVKDKGVGFDSNAIENPYRMGGFGLFSIRERLRYLGGMVSVDSKPASGTLVTLVAPKGPLISGVPSASSGGKEAR